MLKYKFIINKLSFYLIFFVITACAVNDKEAFNIIDEAKKIFLDFPKDEENEKKEKVLKAKEATKKKQKLTKKDRVVEKQISKDHQHNILKEGLKNEKKEPLLDKEVKES